MEIGCSVMWRVQVSQVKDDGGLDRAVTWSHLEGIFIGTMICWMGSEEEEGVQVPGNDLLGPSQS